MATYDRVVVGLTTVPRRVEQLRPVLDSLRAQSTAPDVIYISVPAFSAREQRPYPMEALRAYEAEYPGVKVIVVGEDYGPLTKLMGMLLAEPLARGTLLITVDDDYRMHPRTVEALLGAAEEHPMEAVALNGLRIDMTARRLLPTFSASLWLESSPLTRWMSLNRGDQVNVVMGYSGVAYPRWAFGSEIPNAAMESVRVGSGAIPHLHDHDDLYSSSWLKVVGAKKRQAGPCGRHEALPQSRSFALCAGGSPQRTNSTALRHVRTWAGLVKTLQDRGLLEVEGDMSPVPLYKDVPTVSAAALAAAAVGAVALCFYISRK
jgi:hypothetical protein